MIKGIQKNMIWVQTPKSHCFEEAYFVIRKDVTEEGQRGNEMLREATRILAEHEAMKQTDKKGNGRGRATMLVFFGGMLSGSLLVSLLWLLSVLVG